MEIEILITDLLGRSLGISEDGIYFVRRSKNGYWEEIPAKNEIEALEYFGENVSC